MANQNVKESQSLDTSDLQESLSEQQKEIIALKQLVKQAAFTQSTSNSVHEKAKNLAQQLTHLKSKAQSQQSLHSLSYEKPSGAATEQQAFQLSQTLPIQQDKNAPVSATKRGSTGSEKILLLRQQMEYNKARMSQRVSSKLHLEQLVTEIKEKFNSTQQDLENTSALGKSMNDLSMLSFTSFTPVIQDRHKSATDLAPQTFNLEKERSKYLENRCRLLEKQLNKDKNEATKRINELENKIVLLEESLCNSNPVSIEVNEHQRNEIDDENDRITKLQALNDDLITKSNENERLVENLNIALNAAKEELASEREKFDSLSASQNQNVDLEIVSETVQVDSQIKAEMAKQIQELQLQIQELSEENLKFKNIVTKNESLKVSDASIAEKIAALESTIEAQLIEINNQMENQKKCEEELMEKTIELNVLNANFHVLEEKFQETNKQKPLFSFIAGDSTSNPNMQNDIQDLKKKLDEANKTTIKLKLKCKQLEKQAAKQKTLQDQNQSEKTMSEKAATNISAQSDELNVVKRELEEEICARKQLQECFNEKVAEIDELNSKINELQEEKQNLDKQLTHYINENMKLLDKIEKLSKSSSSAESIEIVERLTQQECAEMEELNSNRQEKDVVEQSANTPNELAQSEMGHELSESLSKLREESSELMNKIELFTVERREVLEKMDLLNAENLELVKKNQTLAEQMELTEHKMQLVEKENMQLEAKLQTSAEGKTALRTQSMETSLQHTELSQELTSLQKSSEVVAALDGPNEIALFAKCEKSLSKLHSELELYRKANDKTAKLIASKKLAKEAKNAYTQLSELLQKVKEASNAVETVTVVETVVAVTAPNGKALAEYEQLSTQNRDLKATVEELRRELQDVQKAMDYGTTTIAAPENQEFIENKMKQISDKLQDATEKTFKYEKECQQLEQTVESLNAKLKEALSDEGKKSAEIIHLKEAIATMQRKEIELDELMNDNEEVFAHQIESMKRLQVELEGKCSTYEREMEILQTLVAEQKQQLIESYEENEVKLTDLQQRDDQIIQLRNELSKYEESLVTFEENKKVESKSLSESLKINKLLAAEQLNELSFKQETIDTLNQQIIDLYKVIEDNTKTLLDKDIEIEDMRLSIETYKIDLENMRKDNDEQRTVFDKVLNELHSQKKSLQLLPQLETKVQHLQNTNEILENVNKELEQQNKTQLEKLKKYAANLKKRTLQCRELEETIQAYKQENSNDNDSSKVILEELTTENLNLREQIGDLKSNLDKSSSFANEIQEALQTKTIDFLETKELISELEDKLKQTQSRLNQKQANEISNNEQILETQILLEQKDNLIKNLEKQIEISTSEVVQIEQKFKAQEQRFGDMQEELTKITLKFEKSKAVIKDRNNQIQHLHDEVKNLNEKLAQTLDDKSALVPQLNEYNTLQQAYKELNDQYANEKSEFQQTIARLETLHAGIQAKLKGDMAYIENLEKENENIKAQIARIEQCAEYYITKRRSMDQYTKLQANTQQEQYQTAELDGDNDKNDLIYRLNTFFKHDEVILEHLLNVQEEQIRAQAQSAQLQLQIDQLILRNSTLMEEYEAYRHNVKLNLENANCSLREQLETANQEMQQIVSRCDAKILEKSTEMTDLECKLNDQLKSLSTENLNVSETLKKTHDECLGLKQEIDNLNKALFALEQNKNELERETIWLRAQYEISQQNLVEVQELRKQTLQDKAEIDNLHDQIAALKTSNEMEVQMLHKQLTDLDILRIQVSQNQTDDQIYIQSENKRLTDLLAEKEAIIEKYQNNLSSLTSLNRNAQNDDSLASTSTPQQISEYANDILPVPSMYFSNDPIESNPFDVIVQASEPPTTRIELGTTMQPNIRDEERNVSDWEKQRQELENKLSEMQNRLIDAEMHAVEQEVRIKALLELEQQQQKRTNTQTKKPSSVDLPPIIEQNRALEIDVYLNETANALEKQLLSYEDTTSPDSGLKPVEPKLEMFFGAAPALEFENLIASSQTSEKVAQEDIIIPKTAYICQPKTDVITDPSTLLGNDWGDSWNTDEAAAEEAHFAKTTTSESSLASREQQLDNQLKEKSDLIAELQLALERSEQQKQDLHNKAGKLMKKLKEYKTKIDDLQITANNSTFRKSVSVESQPIGDGLDAAIEEELKLQIEKLEAKFKEQQKLQDNYAIEKESLLKRIEVLTASHERMIEIKERQDMDMQMYKIRIQELQQKLSNMDNWGQESLDHEKDSNTELEDVEENATVGPDNKTSDETLSSSESQEVVQDASNENLENSFRQTELEFEFKNLQKMYNDLLETNEKITLKLTHLQSEYEREIESLVTALKSQEEQIRDLTTQNKTLTQTNEKHLDDTDNLNQLNSSDEVLARLQEKESENIHLKQRIEDLMHEDQTEKLVLEILTKNQEIHLLKMHVKNLEDDKLEQESKLATEISTAMQADTEALQLQCCTLEKEIQSLKLEVQELRAEKKNMEEELMVLNNHILNTIELEDRLKATITELNGKNIEIAELRQLIKANPAENANNVPENKDIVEINAKWEATVEQKCGEVAQIWREHLLRREKQIEIIESGLREEISALRSAQREDPKDKDKDTTVSIEATTINYTPAAELTSFSSTSSETASKDVTPLHRRMSDAQLAIETDDITIKMQAALESQEMEIMALKEQLAIRSAEYARLAAQYDPFKLQTTLSHSGVITVNNPSYYESSEARRSPTTSDDSLVPKSDLDLALYILHQRDMRCEELMLELVSLLEERDTLQLKLSNTLRQVEAIKTQTEITSNQNEAAGSGSYNLTADSPNKSGVVAATADESAEALNQKLSQLQTVKHSRDKVFREEREQRIWQMERIQQDVAKMPPAAVSKLVGTDLTQSSQPPSLVLLNWLWGNKPNSPAGDTAEDH